MADRSVSLDYFYLLEPPSADDRTWMWAGLSKRWIREYGIESLGALPKAEAHPPSEPLEIVNYRGMRVPSYFGFDGSFFVCSCALANTLARFGSLDLCHPAVLLNRAEDRVLCDDLRWIRAPVGAGPCERNRGSWLLGDFDYIKANPDLEEAVGLYFDVSTWHGLPVFSLERSPNCILVIKPVADFLAKESHPGLKVTPVLEEGRALRDSMLRWPEGNKRGGGRATPNA